MKYSEEHYRSIIEHSNIGIYQTTPEGEILMANPYLIRILGFESFEDLRKRNLNNEGFETGYDRNNFIEKIEKEGSITGYRSKWMRKDNTFLYLNENSRAVRDNTGKTIYYEGTVEDITESILANEKLRRNHETQTIINSIIKLSTSDITIDEVLARSFELIVSLDWLTFEKKGCIFLVEKDPDVLVMKVENNLFPAIRQVCMNVPFGKCLCGKAALKGKVQFASNLDERHEIHYDGIENHGHYCVPIIYSDKVLGVINTYIPPGQKYSAPDVDFLNSVANTLAGVIIRKRAEQELLKHKEQLEETVLLRSSELAKSESQLRAIFDTVIDAIITIDENGNIQSFNNASQKIFGYQREEVLGKNISMLMPEPHKSKHDNYLKKYLEEKDKRTTGSMQQVIGLRKNGETFPMDLSVSEFSVDGKIAFTGIARDISDKIESQKALKDSEEKYRHLSENVVDGIYSVQNGYFKSVNHAMEIMFGYSMEEFIGMPAWNLGAPGKREQVKNEMFRKTKEYDLSPIEIECIRKNGETFMAEVKLNSSDQSGVFFGIISDITERIKDNERLRKLTAAVEQSHAGIVITNAKGVIEYVNPAFSAVTGYSPEEAIGQNPRILKSGYHDDEFYKTMWKTINEGNNWSNEFCNKNKDGELYWESATISPVKNNAGEITHFIAIKENITARKKAEDDLVKAKEAAEDANRMKSEFLANMSHEIRTPMNAIIGFSDLLYLSIKNEKQLSQIDSIRKSSKNLLKIINDILDLSKIEAGKLKIQKEPVNIISVINEIESIFSTKIKEKNLEYSVINNCNDSASIITDGVRLRQILFNLVGNAVKFTDSGHIQITLDKKNSLSNKNKIDLIISIEDTGIGIPIDQHQVIFDAFVQKEGQNSRKYGGTGLGLAITKRLVEMMDGRIILKSEENKGSIFTVILNDIEITNSAAKLPEEDNFDPAGVLFEKAKVLIVDDNKGNREILTDLLSYSPLIIFESENGEEAVRSATENLPDIILMDLLMPVMDGYNASRILKNQTKTSHIPIVAISASVKVIFKKDEMELFNDFLLKPVSIVGLMGILKKYLKYKEVESGSENIEKADKDKTLSNEQILMIPEIVMILEREFIPLYNETLDNQMIDQMEDFGKRIVSLGNKYANIFVSDYGKKICSYANNFETDKLMETMKRFPGFIEYLKSASK